MAETLGALPPRMVQPPPGEATRQWVDLLARTECPALTARRARRQESSGAPQDPIVWAQAHGANVVDVDGNVYVDLTAGFGAAAVGHAHPRVVSAVQQQSERLVHALGDLHPSDVKVRLLERLTTIAPWPDARAILGQNGADAVDAALKTAVLSTGRPGVLAFEGGYHGLTSGPLAACGFGEGFRAPFAAQLNPHVRFAPWPAPDADPAEARRAVERTWDAAETPVGCVLLEPIQGRGGVRIPPPGFLRELRALCTERGALLVADEIQTGLGRTGTLWRSVAEETTVDLVCAGKALGGGMPISACLGPAEVMRAWGEPSGQALHTATFFGHPLACAGALATLELLESEGLAERARKVGRHLHDRLAPLVERPGAASAVHAAGLLVGIDVGSAERCLGLVRALLERGYLVLPAGTDGRVLQLVPPLTVATELLDGFVDTLESLVG